MALEVRVAQCSGCRLYMPMVDGRRCAGCATGVTAKLAARAVEDEDVDEVETVSPSVRRRVRVFTRNKRFQ